MRSKKRVLKNKKFLIAICILILIILGTLIYFCTKNKKIETSAQPMEEREFEEENINEENPENIIDENIENNISNENNNTNANNKKLTVRRVTPIQIGCFFFHFESANYRNNGQTQN